MTSFKKDDKQTNQKTSQEILAAYETDHKIYCKNCNSGYGVVFKHKDIDRKLCRVCGHWIYRDERTRLKYEMKERGVKVD